MILTCPSCATRYEADAAKFLPAGRKVRCAKCGHTWHQPAPASGHEIPAAEPAKESADAGAADPSPAVAAAPETVPETPMAASVATAAKPRTGWRTGALTGWAILFVVVALLCWLAVAFRQGIASVWPQTATFYNAAGLTVNTVGLAFEDVSYRVTSEDDQPVLHIKGKIVNITQRELTVPAIQAALIDEARRHLYDWNIVAQAKTLAPGKATTFQAHLPSPPSGARHVDLKFVKS
jgi:predicted Zn finger-like uncharacterized protein